MNNKNVLEEMEAWSDSIITANEAASDSTNKDSSNVEILDTLLSSEEQIPFSERKLPGIREESPIDYTLKGINKLSEELGTPADWLSSAMQADYSRTEDPGPQVNENIGDYSRALISNTLGMPVDTANLLLSLLYFFPAHIFLMLVHKIHRD